VSHSLYRNSSIHAVSVRRQCVTFVTAFAMPQILFLANLAGSPAPQFLAASNP
jgi:hypothetical protein